MTYAEALAVLDALPRWADQGAAAYQPGLDRMRALLAAMGEPHTRYPSVHIGGTNGKGSTASMVAAIGTAAGRRVGLHTSPHLFDFAERLRLDGVPVPHDWIAEAVDRFRSLFEEVGPSYFEASVALALLYFAEASVDLAVVEVGLGGRLDATNVLTPVACGVASIGLDHTDLLGDTLDAIAREKAGIAKPGIPFLTAADAPEALATLQATAEAVGAPFEDVRATVRVAVGEADDALALSIETPVRDYGTLRAGLAGRHQAWNAALAVRLAEVAFAPEADAVREGLLAVVRLSGLRGRGEVWQEKPRIVADVAHNPDGWRAALAHVQPGPGGRRFVLAGVLSDKDADAFARLLAGAKAVVLPVALPSARALPLGAWKGYLAAAGVLTHDVADVPAGVAWFNRAAKPGDVLLVTGSHLTVAALGEPGTRPAAAR